LGGVRKGGKQRGKRRSLHRSDAIFPITTIANRDTKGGKRRRGGEGAAIHSIPCSDKREKKKGTQKRGEKGARFTVHVFIFHPFEVVTQIRGGKICQGGEEKKRDIFLSRPPGCDQKEGRKKGLYGWLTRLFAATPPQIAKKGKKKEKNTRKGEGGKGMSDEAYPFHCHLIL